MTYYQLPCHISRPVHIQITALYLSPFFLEHTVSGGIIFLELVVGIMYLLEDWAALDKKKLEGPGQPVSENGDWVHINF